MYLKSLVIHGFKSFADKTKLDFDAGVTGIVGSNGCGKSNVVDAIRWVLGETSAKAMRGGEMADVIFSGTQERKPMGMAEVTLTMGDCEELLKVDYNEVSISRRVFRDGKSEYRINGTLCRLRDLHDLFMDTGIGRTAYSIMEQGKIDMLLSSKPEDRRQVFEEAAGITKFKKEKKEALRKLDYTQANLLRVSDVLEEQERRMSTLKRQVARARRFQKLSAQVKVLDTHLSHRRYVEMRAAVGEAQKSTRLLELRERELLEDLPQREQAVVEARDKAQALERQLAELRQSLLEHRSRASGAQSKISFNRERKAELEARIEQNNAEVSEISQKLSQQELDLEYAAENLSEITAQIGKHEQALRNDEAALLALREKRQFLEREMRELARTVRATQAKIATAEAQIESSLAQIERDKQRAEQLRLDEKRLWQDREKAQQLYEEISEALATEKQTLLGLEEALGNAERAYQKQRGDVDSLRASAADEQSKLAMAASKLSVLKGLVARGEGMGSGVKAVMDGLEDKELFGSAVRGVLANMVKVDAEFSVALEAALGSQMQLLVVRNALLAEGIIEKLAKNQWGKVQLIAEEFLPQQEQTQLEYVPQGGLAWALDKVSSEPMIANLLEHFLRHVLIVKDLATALQIREQYPDLSFTTLDGIVISADGVITGGSGGADGEGSLLQRQNEIEQLTQEVEQLEKRDADYRRQISERETELSECLEMVEKTRERVQKARIEESTLKGKLSLARREVEAAESKIQAIAQEREALGKHDDRSAEKREALELTLVQGKSEMEAAESKQMALQNQLEEILSQESEAQQKLNEVKTKVAVERRAIQAAQEQQKPMVVRLKELNDLRKKRIEEVAQFKEKIVQAAAETEELKTIVAENTAAAEKHDAMLEKLSATRPQLLESIHLAEKKVNELRQMVTKVAEQKGKAEVEATKLELRLENLTTSMQDRYQIDISQFMPDLHALRECLAELSHSSAESTVQGSPNREEIDWVAVATYLGEVKRKVDGMGPVNVDAIAEYDELEERFSFVQGQCDDLTHARDELVSMIDKINAETRKRFTKTFEQVRKNFQKMFKILFGELGQADLHLLDDGDPLESGIEIIAKPPGKTLQSITLLSGGERSMIAVALLFSIYQIKPSPFCVLDELDAPLDESNIARFLNVLDQFIDKSQFIIVTHSKRTMSRADVIYGITMEERGVSKPVSLRLTDKWEV